MKCGKCCCTFELKLLGKDPNILDAKKCILNNFKQANIVLDPAAGIDVWFRIKGRCIHLDKNNLCKIYSKRSKRCRDFDCADQPISPKKGKASGFSQKKGNAQKVAS